MYIFRPAHSYKDARPAFCRVWHTEWNRVISRFFFRRGVRCTMGPIAVIGHDLYLNIVYPAVSSNMARKSPIHVQMGWCKYFPASHVWLLFPRGYILVRFQAMKNGDADKDPVGQSNIGYIRLQNSSMPSESNIDFAARPYTQQEHSWESVETNPGGWLFLWGLSHVTMFPWLEGSFNLVGGLEHFLISPYIGNSYPNWLIFFRGVEATNQNVLFASAISPSKSIQNNQFLLVGWPNPTFHATSQA